MGAAASGLSEESQLMIYRTVRRHYDANYAASSSCAGLDSATVMQSLSPGKPNPALDGEAEAQAVLDEAMLADLRHRVKLALDHERALARQMREREARATSMRSLLAATAGSERHGAMDQRGAAGAEMGGVGAVAMVGVPDFLRPLPPHPAAAAAAAAAGSAVGGCGPAVGGGEGVRPTLSREQDGGGGGGAGCSIGAVSSGERVSSSSSSSHNGGSAVNASGCSIGCVVGIGSGPRAGLQAHYLLADPHEVLTTVFTTVLSTVLTCGW